MMVVARYNNMIFTCDMSRKLGGMRDRWKINFIDFFEGTDEMFISTYKPKYPQYQFQIYKHIKKPTVGSSKSLKSMNNFKIQPPGRPNN